MGTHIMNEYEFSKTSSGNANNYDENTLRFRRDQELQFSLGGGDSRNNSPMSVNGSRSRSSAFSVDGDDPSTFQQFKPGPKTMMPTSTAINDDGKGKSHLDQVQKLAGLSIGFCSIFSEQLLSHPCIVLRRQCQVHHSGSWHHLTPISLVQVIINIQRTQGGLVLWKGLGGVYIVKGIGIVSESLLTEVTSFPREVSRRSSIKKFGGHLLLKSLVYAVSAPFYTASLIETVQSDIASERPGVFDVLFEGVARLGSFVMPHTSRQLPTWQLTLPTVFLRLSHYVVSSIAQFTVTSTMQLEQAEMRQSQEHREPTAYDVYFPELMATFTGGILADVITFPLETVLHRLYVQGTRTIIDNTDSGLGVEPIITGYEGLVDCFRSILAEEGIPGFYRGFGALILQYGVHAAILKIVMFLFEKLAQEIKRRQIAQNQPQNQEKLYKDLTNQKPPTVSDF